MAIYFGLLPFSETHFLRSASGNDCLAGNVIYGLWPHGLYSSGCLLLLVTSAWDPDTWDSRKHLKGLKEGIFFGRGQCDQPLYRHYMLRARCFLALVSVEA